MEFIVTPHVGALPITFAMEAKDVANLIGPAKDETVDGGECKEFRWSGKKPSMPLHVFYSADGKVVEIEFGKDCILRYKGIDIFREANVIKKLAADDQPKKYKSTILFQKLGISMVGFDDPDTEKNVTVFRAGRWDRLLKKATDLDLK